MRVTSNPKPHHLDQIKEWLNDEYNRNLNGFFGNIEIISKSFKEKNAICIIENHVAVGFMTYYISEKACHISIANIKHEYKGKGLGRKLLSNLEQKLIKKGVLVIELKCSPINSKKIWKRLGFKEFIEIENHRFLNSKNNPYPYLYKPLSRFSKPLKINSKSNDYIELYCTVLKKDSDLPNYAWNLNSATLSSKPIIYPIDYDWHICFYKKGILVYDGKIKRLNKGLNYFINFLIIDKTL